MSSGKGHDISNEPEALTVSAPEIKVKKKSIFSRSRRSSLEDRKDDNANAAVASQPSVVIVPDHLVVDTAIAVSPFSTNSPPKQQGSPVSEQSPGTGPPPSPPDENVTTKRAHRNTITAKLSRSQEEKIAQIESMLQEMLRTGMNYIALLPPLSTVDESDGKASEERSCRFFLDGIELKIEAVNFEQYETVRKIYGVSEAEIADSICAKVGMSGGVSKGKSGSFIFFTKDLKFVLKSLTAKESDLLEFRMMPEYAKYVSMFPHTLIPRLLGTYRISMPDSSQTWRIMVMNNVLETSLYIHERYDLKGSIIGRAASAKEKAKYGKETVMKDLDFKDNGRSITISRQTRFALLLQIENDIKFLKDLGIMDYSLFVGIHFYGEELPSTVDASENTTAEDGFSELKEQVSEDSNASQLTLTHIRKNSGHFEQLKAKIQAQASFEIEHQDSSEMRTSGSDDFASEPERSPQKSLPSIVVPVTPKFQSLFKVDDGGLRSRLPTGALRNEHYFIGIIDILQTYDVGKVMETGLKSIKHNKDKLSSVEPEQYMERFLAYVKTIIQ
eukprot:TRINITY_DN5599_c0_g2_i1.p1 TRINITY_DN5599_c0_g2~~TRINITY_DN5599_c0_g2_i1.p1  ORF type:complete len:557 (-),score=156.38 TRINITY_DN5599_c0_g2_i1:200-1870(-)